MSEDWGTKTGSSWSENLPELSLREMDRMDKRMLKRNVGKFLGMTVGSAAVSVVMPSGLNHTSVWIKFYTFVWSLCYVNYISKKSGKSLVTWSLQFYVELWHYITQVGGEKQKLGKEAQAWIPGAREMMWASTKDQRAHEPERCCQPTLRFQLPFLMLLRNQGQNIHREHC